MVPKRQFKPTPLMRTSEENRNARRSLFLKKVQSGREDKKWKVRGGEDEVQFFFFSCSLLPPFFFGWSGGEHELMIWF
jgi:hypothetical protein